MRDRDIAHEIWATAQLMPGEGIEDGVDRIVGVLKENFKADQEVNHEDNQG